MSSKKLSNNPSTLAAHASRVVKFTGAEADQDLLSAIETALAKGSYVSFNDLCKQALRQLLLSPPTQTTSPGLTSDTSLLLQQQMVLMQQQIAHLEGALGMKQIISLNRLEQEIIQLDRRTAEQAAQFALRLDQLEATTANGKTNHSVDSHEPEMESSDLATDDPDLNPVLNDPLLSRLMPLLEDF